jgi:amidohydrolase
MLKRFLPALLLCFSPFCRAAEPGANLAAQINAIYPEVEALYVDLHQNPELSLHEEKTAAKLADRLRKLGYEVTTGVGGTGIVALMKNGAGPVISLRTDMDALPVEEKTGLPYASKVRTKDDAGNDVPVMHACGHDVHMASWIGTATIMATTKDQWHGTLLLIGQPAEERVMGAKAMLKAGFLQRFPKPEFGIASHVSNILPAGQVGFSPGFALANSDSVNITIWGKGGHGAKPDATVDPIVIAARTIMALQTIVSREMDPMEQAVVTVGQIHGGTKNNIISDHVDLGLSVRTYKDDIRKKVLEAIQRIAKAEALAANAPKPPDFAIPESTPATFNDPQLASRLEPVLKNVVGDMNVVHTAPIMGSEDYSEFVRAGIPSLFFWVGGAEPDAFAKAKADGTQLPSNHSPFFAPDREPTLKTAITAEVALLRELLK